MRDAIFHQVALKQFMISGIDVELERYNYVLFYKKSVSIFT